MALLAKAQKLFESSDLHLLALVGEAICILYMTGLSVLADTGFIRTSLKNPNVR